MIMFNLKEARGTYKKLILECMFKCTRQYAVITKYWNKARYFAYFGRHLTKQQMEFLSDHWHSIDAVEIDSVPVLYEIRENKPSHNINESSLLLFNKAIGLGFKVKLGLVSYHNNWNYSVEIVDFSKEDCSYSKVFEKPLNEFI